MAKLGTCKSCGTEVSVNAKTCPKCGEPKPIEKRAGLVAWIVAGVVVYVMFSAFSEQTPSASTAPPPQPAPAKAKATVAKAAPSDRQLEEQIALVVNANGHLCAKVTHVQPLKVRADMYEVTCMEYRGGSTKKVYHFDAAKNVVWIP